MIQPVLGSFTVDGSAELETRIRNIVSDVARIVADVVPADAYYALVLMGGYGRGEGGVRRGGDEVERPSNNLDFLLISRRASTRQLSDWQAQVDRRLGELQVRYDIGIDFSTILGSVLRRSACRVMWYDMRGGHKTVLGDVEFVRSLDQFRVDRIPAWDVHNLLVNRGTLLVINDCLPADRREKLRQLRLRHTVKAIIGYGDALLFTHGQYHWSYVEKRRRMRCNPEIDADFRALYDAAASYRLAPREPVDPLLEDAGAIQRECDSVHRKFESTRLNGSFDRWYDGVTRGLEAGLWEDALTPGGWLRSLRNLLKNRPRVRSMGRYASLSQRALSPQRLLSVLFPAVAYPTGDDRLKRIVAHALSAKDESPSALKRAYLRAWGETVDRNFVRFLDRYGIDVAS